MPHLSELQRAYSDQDVTIIGMTSEDPGNTLEKVKKMVAEKADVMDFSVAWDVERQTNEAYMKASGQRGIPTSFLVDQDGKIAWIGHPNDADVPLAQVVAGTWDYEAGPAMMKQMAEARTAIYRAVSEEPARAYELLQQFAVDHPHAAKGLSSLRFSILSRLPEHEAEATALGRKIVDKAIAADDAMALNGFAWNLVDPEAERENRFLKLAMLAADKANELTHEKDAAILDTVARVHFWLGNLDKALEVQIQAVENAEGRMKEALQEVLREYEQAVSS